MNTFGPETICHLLRDRGRAQGDRIAFTFLLDGEIPSVELTYAELDRQACLVAAALGALGTRGRTVLLLYGDGPEFIPGFLGSLYARAIPVPTFPPHAARLERTLPRLLAIAADAGVAAILTTNEILALRDALVEQAPELGRLPWIATDALHGSSVAPDLDARPGDLAYLQYTSGSTGTPRGVRVTHGNLMHNEGLIHRAFGTTPELVAVGWLPMFHDMGLIGNVLGTLYIGGSCMLMSPVAFLQHPIRWLRAISRYHATGSGGPNFAYDLCVRKTTAEQRAELDLSSWQTAFCGAEPVQHEVLDRFARAFEASGFRSEAFLPCYGLAEATLLVSGGNTRGSPTRRSFDAGALERNRIEPVDAASPIARAIIGCGGVPNGHRVLIVDPGSRKPCPPDRIGEIWVDSASVADGYWNRPEESAEVFSATLASSGEGPFLRTGDLGFLRDGELFITGRLKDLVIIRGRNHYPQDIEVTVQSSHRELRPGCGVAFSVERDGAERLVVVQEVKSTELRDAGSVLSAIRRAISREHDLGVDSVLLVRPRSVPKTSSGKLQRRACRQAFLEGTLDLVAEWSGAASQRLVSIPTSAAISSNGHSRSAVAIERWLLDRIGTTLAVDPVALDPSQPVADLGLDSAAAVSLAGDLENWLGRAVPATIVWEHPSVRALAQSLAGAALLPAGPALTESNDPIAIVGVGCRFPMAAGPEAFWELLRDGVDAVQEVPAGRTALDRLRADAAPRWGGFLAAVDEFDAEFFRISPREAVSMDPQQRLLLEVAVEALDDAGLPLPAVQSCATGVFVGISSCDYAWLQVASGDVDLYFATGSALSIAANRISYALGLRGPSLAIDTACSSSLVALHLACRSLRAGECDAALVGGASLILRPEVSQALARTGALSPTGRCRSFDADADGYARGEGAGMVVLKPLARARADGDRVYAVIRGSAVNSDGASNGLMAPNPRAQEAVLRTAYAESGVDPATVDYVEAHGTGTPLGDPIEARALGAVVGAGRPGDAPCRIGSVKTNIGHLEAAAGVAGIIKVAVSLAHRTLPPSLHFSTPNPLIDFSALGLRVQSQLESGFDTSRPLRAGVSSFGFGGTNAHAVLEEAETPRDAHDAAAGATTPTAHLVPVSARSPGALAAQLRGLADWVTTEAPALRDLAYTSALRRTHHAHRAAIVAGSQEEFADRAYALTGGRGVTGASLRRSPVVRAPRVAFVFSGQGSQWVGMGRDLLEAQPVFRERVEACAKAFAVHAGFSLLEELARGAETSRLSETVVAQPALFAVQVGLAALWRSWGIEPAVVVGHSLGEVTAAYVAACLSLEDAVRVVFHRSKLMQRATGLGTMVSVDAAPEQVEASLRGHELEVAIAAYNSPNTVVVSGARRALEAVVAQLTEQGIPTQPLRVDYAFHSPQMEPYRVALEAALAGLVPAPGTLSLISTVTGRSIAGEPMDAVYWARNLCEPVRFRQAIAQLRGEGVDVFLEVGAHPVLQAAIAESACAPSPGDQDPLVVPSLRRQCAATDTLLSSLGELYVSGCEVDWAALHRDGGRVVSLPAYPWQRERHWVKASRKSTSVREFAHAVLQRRLDSPALSGFVVEGELDPECHPWLATRQVGEATELPGALWLELPLAAARLRGDRPGLALQLKAVQLPAVVALAADERYAVQVVLDAEERGDWTGFEVFGRTVPAEGKPGSWKVVGRGRLRPVMDFDASVDAEIGEIEELEVHEDLARGPRAWALPPALLESAVTKIVAHANQEAGAVWSLNQVQRLMLSPGDRWGEVTGCRVCVSEVSPERIRADIALLDGNGCSIARLEGAELRRRSPWEIERAAGFYRDVLYRLDWRESATSAALESRGQERWLLLADDGSFGTELAKELEAGRAQCVLASRADRFEQHGFRRFGIRPGDRQDLVRLVSLEEPFDHVVHLRTLDETGAATINPHSVMSSYKRVCLGAAALVQALIEVGQAPRLCFVSRGAQVVGDAATCVQAMQAPLWGLGSAIALEHPEMRSVLIDLDPTGESTDEARALARQLASDVDEERLALRHGRWFAARLSPVSRLRRRELRLREDATYLVTGGLGGLGLELARWLAKHGARHLILVGRSGAASDESKAAMQELENAGVRVQALSADVSSERELRDVLEFIGRELPVLRGVFHLAGVLDDSPIVDQRPESIERVLGPKALGAWNLHRLTDDLDHFVLFSSVSATFPSYRLGAYAAANAFLDALAEERALKGLPALSIGWGPWGESGMAARLGQNYLQSLSAMGLGAMTSEEALDLLEVLLANDLPHTLAVRLNADRYGDFVGGDTTPPLLRDLTTEVVDSAYAEGSMEQSLISMRIEEREVWIENEIRTLVAEALGTVSAADVAPERQLPELGLDSLIGLELRNRLQRRLGIRFPVRVLFLRSTAREIAKTLARLVGRVEGTDGSGDVMTADILRAEVVLDPAIRSDSSCVTGTCATAFLTGATGFLGAFLLDELLRETDARIFCLVRAKGVAEARNRLRSNLERYDLQPDGFAMRVVPVPGDLALPRLGLDEAAWRRLAEQVDTIYHNGAALNVEGTHEILRLAADGVAKAVHFVSTMGVHGRGTTYAREHDSLEEPPEGLQHGYSESKWVAEGLLRRASERGIAVCIYRPGIIVGDSRTGACAPSDLFNSWMRACIEVGAAPDLENPFDMTPVDYVAQALVRLSMDRAHHGTSYHLVNPSPISARKLVEFVDACGYSIQIEAYDRWYARILRAGGRDDFPLRKHLKLLPSSGRHLFLQPPRSDSAQALAHLQGSGVEFPSIDTRFMEVTLRYLRRLGLIRRAAQQDA